MTLKKGKITWWMDLNKGIISALFDALMFVMSMNHKSDLPLPLLEMPSVIPTAKFFWGRSSMTTLTMQRDLWLQFMLPMISCDTLWEIVQNILPKSINAVNAMCKDISELNEEFTGVALNLPTFNIIMDLICHLEKVVKYDEDIQKVLSTHWRAS